MATPLDIEMGTLGPPLAPHNSPAAQPVPAAFSASTGASATVPTNMKAWYTHESFKTISFFAFCISVLGICTSLIFTDRLSRDQFLGILSSLLFLMTPSPLDKLKKKKEKIYVDRPI